MKGKESWPDGPWHREADRDEWVDPSTGLTCLVNRNMSLGFLCGYVGVPPGHPWHGKNYYDLPVDVHGGLTYARECDGHICHVPSPGEPEHLWWLGFDCGHAFDLAPGMEALRIEKGWPLHADDRYCDMIYVKAEVARLAEQAYESWKKEKDKRTPLLTGPNLSAVRGRDDAGETL